MDGLALLPVETALRLLAERRRGRAGGTHTGPLPACASADASGATLDAGPASGPLAPTGAGR